MHIVFSFLSFEYVSVLASIWNYVVALVHNRGKDIKKTPNCLSFHIKIVPLHRIDIGADMDLTAG